MVAAAVRGALTDAGIDNPADVHFVQVKCPLLTAQRVGDAEERGAAVMTRDTLKSMGLSRAASALGVAVALGEIERSGLDDERIGNDWSLWSGRASCSAGVELLGHEVVVFGMSSRWSGPLAIDHAVMTDAIDIEPVRGAIGRLGLADRWPTAASGAPSAACCARQSRGEPRRPLARLSAHHAGRLRYFINAPCPRLCLRGASRSGWPRGNLCLRRGRASRPGWRWPGRADRRSWDGVSRK